LGSAAYSTPQWKYGITTSARSPERVAEAVRAAGERADVVIPYFHWGVEYAAEPNARQRSLAYAAIDAGADLVLGAHPHWVQTTERYEDTLIVYSMGNFVFDQEWSRETKRGVIATFAFDGAEVTAVEYTPILIVDFNQPRPATGADYTAVLTRLGASARE
jgi:poly-gamma-glutamate synthesis protein (capsule biosynthesis protein)